MAKEKKSFVLYTDLIYTVDKLSNEQAGTLLKHLLRYVNDQNPVCDDPIIDIVFEPIKQQLKRDLYKWGKEKQDRSNNGRLGNLKRWNKDLYDKVIDNQLDIDQAEKIATDRKLSPPDPTRSPTVANVAVNDNVSVNVNDNDINIPFDQFWDLYGKKNNKASCEKKWDKLKDSEREAIMNHLPKYIKSTPDKQYRKNPDSYLNQRHWENEIAIESKTYNPNGAATVERASFSINPKKS